MVDLSTSIKLSMLVIGSYSVESKLSTDMERLFLLVVKTLNLVTKSMKVTGRKTGCTALVFTSLPLEQNTKANGTKVR